MTEEVGTVLVLGAGASKHYGYPTGDELIERIIKKIDSNRSVKNNPPSNSNYATLSYLLKTYDPISIDAFLGREVRRRPEIITAGKEMIARILFSHENDSLFTRDIEERFTPDSQDELNERYIEGILNVDDLYRLIEPHFIKKNERSNWYRFLWQAMMSGKADGQNVVDNPGIHIITFNYDLSLEVALFKWIEQTDFFDSSQKVQFIESMENRIIHPYGRIRDLKKNDAISGQELLDAYRNASNDYGKFNYKNDQEQYDLLSDAVKNIHVINEERTSIPEQKYKHKVVENFERAQDWLKKAKKVYFLGFGFDDTNVGKSGLNLKEILGNQGLNNKCSIYATNFNNHYSIKNKLEQITKRTVYEIKNFDKQCADSQIIVTSEKNVYRALSEDFSLILTPY